MTTLHTISWKRTWMTPLPWLLAGVALLAAGAGTPAPAQARVRIAAHLHTPHVDVRVGTYSHGPRYRPTRRVVVRRIVHDRLSRHDRRVAKRLARYTGIPRREILALRRFGWTWREIGIYYDIPPRVLRAARTGRRLRVSHRHRHRHHDEESCRVAFGSYEDVE